MRFAHYLSELRHDSTFSVRQMIANKGFALVAIATLALGIGATTAIFSTLNAVVLRPLPIPAPDRVLTVWEVWRDQGRGNVSAGNFVDVAAAQKAFSAM